MSNTIWGKLSSFLTNLLVALAGVIINVVTHPELEGGCRDNQHICTLRGRAHHFPGCLPYLLIAHHGVSAVAHAAVQKQHAPEAIKRVVTMDEETGGESGNI